MDMERGKSQKADMDMAAAAGATLWDQAGAALDALPPWAPRLEALFNALPGLEGALELLSPMPPARAAMAKLALGEAVGRGARAWLVAAQPAIGSDRDSAATCADVVSLLCAVDPGCALLVQAALEAVMRPAPSDGVEQCAAIVRSFDESLPNVHWTADLQPTALCLRAIGRMPERLAISPLSSPYASWCLAPVISQIAGRSSSSAAHQGMTWAFSSWSRWTDADWAKMRAFHVFLRALPEGPGREDAVQELGRELAAHASGVDPEAFAGPAGRMALSAASAASHPGHGVARQVVLIQRAERDAKSPVALRAKAISLAVDLGLPSASFGPSRAAEAVSSIGSLCAGDPEGLALSFERFAQGAKIEVDASKGPYAVVDASIEEALVKSASPSPHAGNPRRQSEVANHARRAEMLDALVSSAWLPEIWLGLGPRSKELLKRRGESIQEQDLRFEALGRLAACESLEISGGLVGRDAPPAPPRPRRGL